MGGYDIYWVSWNGRGWDWLMYMGMFVNSSYNDLYYVCFFDCEWVFFVFNCFDLLVIFWDDGEEVCCNDFYIVGIIDEIKFLVLIYYVIEFIELLGIIVVLYEFSLGG